MSRLAAALEQLDGAIDRLETAMARRVEGERAERARLEGELRGLRSHHSSLQTEARTVSSRLDAAIGRLKSLIEA